MARKIIEPTGATRASREVSSGRPAAAPRGAPAQSAREKGSSLRQILSTSWRAALLTLVITGLLYPLAVTGAAQLLFPGRANGSFVEDEHRRVVGSELIAQAFASPAYFQPRPSAAGKGGYDATASGGSNLGPTSKRLRDDAQARAESLRAANPDAPADVPAELVTASASGLDPHISLEAARWQATRIAKVRDVARERVLGVIEEVAEGRDLGFLGEPRVNVLMLNLALDRHFGQPFQSPMSPADK